MSQLDLAYAEWRGRVDGSRFPKREPGAGWNPTWLPHDPDERRECCDKIRTPSRQYPHSLLSHCKSAKHVASLFNINRKDLLAMHRRLTAKYKPVEFSTEKNEKEWEWF